MKRKSVQSRFGIQVIISDTVHFGMGPGGWGLYFSWLSCT